MTRRPGWRRPLPLAEFRERPLRSIPPVQLTLPQRIPPHLRVSLIVELGQPQAFFKSQRQLALDAHRLIAKVALATQRTHHFLLQGDVALPGCKGAIVDVGNRVDTVTQGTGYLEVLLDPGFNRTLDAGMIPAAGS